MHAGVSKISSYLPPLSVAKKKKILTSHFLFLYYVFRYAQPGTHTRAHSHLLSKVNTRRSRKKLSKTGPPSQNTRKHCIYPPWNMWRVVRPRVEHPTYLLQWDIPAVRKKGGPLNGAFGKKAGTKPRADTCSHPSCISPSQKYTWTSMTHLHNQVFSTIIHFFLFTSTRKHPRRKKSYACILATWPRWFFKFIYEVTHTRWERRPSSCVVLIPFFPYPRTHENWEKAILLGNFSL